MNPNEQNQQPQMPGGQPYAVPVPGNVPYPPTASAVPAPPSMPQMGGSMPAVQPPQTTIPPQMPQNASIPGLGAPQPQQMAVPGMPVTGAAPQPMPGTIPGQPSVAGATVRPAASNPNSTQNMLQIAEIRDGIVIMSDGSFRSVVMVNSINFDLMSPQEQEAVEFNYQSFLNSLYFPIQIFLRSQKVDLSPYIEKLDKIRSEHDNMLLALLMEDYIGYMELLSQQTNIMDKNFYIIIPFFPHVDIQKAFTQSKNFLTGFAALFDNKEQHVTINEADLEKAKTELRNRVQTVMDGLMQCSVQSLPLDTKELIELFYDTYNPDTATRQQLKNFGNMDADIVTKGKGAAPQPHLERELI